MLRPYHGARCGGRPDVTETYHRDERIADRLSSRRNAPYSPLHYIHCGTAAFEVWKFVLCPRILSFSRQAPTNGRPTRARRCADVFNAVLGRQPRRCQTRCPQCSKMPNVRRRGRQRSGWVLSCRPAGFYLTQMRRSWTRCYTRRCWGRLTSRRSTACRWCWHLRAASTG